MWILVGLAFGFVLVMVLLPLPAVWLASLLRGSALVQQEAALSRGGRPSERRAKPFPGPQRRAKSTSR